MDKKGVKEYKEMISKEVEGILRYISSFEVHSAKDLQALTEVYTMLTGVSAAIVKIEESHQRRIHLTSELTRALDDIESQSAKFAEKYAKNLRE